jgi:DNA-binding PadR family transcriptional regulator
LFVHLLLGLLRDGQPHHGYELMSQYRRRSGSTASAGSFYRVLARLTNQGLVTAGANPPDVDTRRIPYQITERGAQAFDRWLVSPGSSDELTERLLFVDRLPHDAMTRLLDRWQEELWLRGKALARMHADAVHDRPRVGDARPQPLPALLTRRMKQVEADLEFLKGFRLEFDAWLQKRRASAEKPPQPATKRSRAPRDRGGRSR